MSPEPIPGVYDPPGAHVWGWMLPPELEWLYLVAGEMASIVEVGSLHGRSAFALLKGCRGPVYCIDPWNDEHGLCLPSFMRSCGGFPNLVPVQGYSPAVQRHPMFDNLITTGSRFDMVFIDGNHGWADIEADVEAWLPLTRRLICGHDYQPEHGDAAGYPDVARYIDERFAGRVFRPEGTSIWSVWLEEPLA